MDHTRNALFAGLALVSYLMLLAWNDDYPQQVQQNTDFTPVGNSLNLPETTNNNLAEDLPQIQTSSEPIVTTATAANSSLIAISTPVHEVTIDLLGGDIVSIALPKYPTSLDTPNDPFILLRNDNGGVYVSQSGLIGENGPDASATGRPLYQTQQTEYSIDSGELSVDLLFTDPSGVKIVKRFNFSADDYLIDIEYLIDNQSQSPWSANLFGQIKRDGAPDPSTTSGFGLKDFLGAAISLEDDPYKKIDFDDIDDGEPSYNVNGGWIAFSQHYFLSSWIPPQNQINTYSTRKNNAGEYLLGFVSPATIVAPGETQSIEAGYWAGPKDQNRLEEIHQDLDLTIDYGFLWFIAQPIFWLLMKINGAIGNYGWSIIGLTIVIKILFMRLSAASYRSMAKMKRLAPKVQQLKDRYGDDKQKLMQEQMALWKKEKVNPLGGCLPMLLQMPVLIGIYWVLMKSVELRQAPFLLWYNDLSLMDPYFILPLIMGASMFVSQTLSPMATADPIQAKVMKLMPVIFTIFFLWFPAGLVLYWIISNVFNILQQSYIIRSVNRSYENKTA
ncbi:MAG: membrane protein insertase YidC [SAR86 cluster bacterium]|uniref:Membrane protein insertase YidC n=1 Tax=SAR86 cluster bacterium TaxID=2030880 RepID=A0A2A5CIG8_9GAMM|nr:MAG: membrane protein insertase YidC [SAR86 cluster bacterium]